MASYYNQPSPSSGRRHQPRYQAYGVNTNNNNNTQNYASYSAENGPPTNGYQQHSMEPPASPSSSQQGYQNYAYGNGPPQQSTFQTSPQQQYQGYSSNSNSATMNHSYYSNNSSTGNHITSNTVGYNAQQQQEQPPLHGNSSNNVFNQDPPATTQYNASNIANNNDNSNNNSNNSKKAIYEKKGTVASRYGQYGVRQKTVASVEKHLPSASVENDSNGVFGQAPPGSGVNSFASREKILRHEELHNTAQQQYGRDNTANSVYNNSNNNNNSDSVNLFSQPPLNTNARVASGADELFNTTPRNLNGVASNQGTTAATLFDNNDNNNADPFGAFQEQKDQRAKNASELFAFDNTNVNENDNVATLRNGNISAATGETLTIETLDPSLASSTRPGDFGAQISTTLSAKGGEVSPSGSFKDEGTRNGVKFTNTPKDPTNTNASEAKLSG